MNRTKVHVPALAKAPPKAVPATIQRAATAPVRTTKPAVKPVAKAIDEPEVNASLEPAAAAIVPFGQAFAAGHIQIVAPRASITPPPGSVLRGFIHPDGSAVKFAGAAGAVHLERADAKADFGPLFEQALSLLQVQKPKAAPMIQRAAASPGKPGAGAAQAIQRAAEAGSGRPLPGTTRSKLESSFGTDLSRVRVHTDSTADTAARSVQAHAFTTGQDIFFRTGQFQPETPSGQKLIAHEAAHTVQQGNAAVVALKADTPDVSQPGDALEREAETAADRAVSGQAVRIQPMSSGASAPVARLAASPAPPAPQPIAAPAKSETHASPKAAPLPPAAPPPPKGEKKDGDEIGPKVEAAEVKAKPAKDATHGEEPTAEPAPVSTNGLAAVTEDVQAAGRSQKKHEPAFKKADEAKTSAAGPANEVEAEAKKRQVEAMAGQRPKPFDKESFKLRLKKKIEDIRIADAEQAKQFKEQGGAKSVKDAAVADAKSESATAGGAIAQTSHAAPNAAGIAKTPGAELAAAKPGAAPKVDATRAVPAARPEGEVTLQPETQALDEKLTAAGTTPDTLRKSNEPAFQDALVAKASAHDAARTGAEQVRQEETGTLAKSRTDAQTSAAAGLAGMHGGRAANLTAAFGMQSAGKRKHEEAKARIAKQFAAIYEDTKGKVDARLKKLDSDVYSQFDSGASLAQMEFESFVSIEIFKWAATRYLGDGLVVGAVRAIRDAFKGWPPEVNQFYEQGRAKFVARMNKVIDIVAETVKTGLDEVVDLIAKGRQRAEDEARILTGEEASIGQDALLDIQGKFTDLEKSVEEKQNHLIDGLAKKYVDAVKKVDDTISAWKQATRGLIAVAGEALQGVLDTIQKIKTLLQQVFAKAGEAIDLILADPMAFLAHLADGVKQGLNNFVANIGTHLKKGLLDWLFGAVAGAGIKMPAKFDLAGLLDLVLQILGLTWTNVRKRAVAILGEKVVKTLETASEIILALITKGPGGLWDYIKEQAAAFLDTLKAGIESFIIEAVIKAGVKWIIGLLNPASAFIKACMAIYDIVTWIINKGAQLLEFVNAVLDSVLSIAKGNIGPAAAAVEAALAKAVPVAIGFLASLLGLGDLSGDIKKVIDKIQKPVNDAIDWVIKKAVQLVKAAGNALGFGGKDQKKDLGNAKNAARDAIHNRLGAEATVAETERVLPQVLRELQPIGLRSLTLGPRDEKGEYPILAEASLRERISALAGKQVIVAVSAKITMKAENTSTLDEIQNLRESKELIFDKMPTSQHSALGGSGRAARLPPVDQPPRTPAKHGSQPSSGLIIEPARGTQLLEVVAWNTSQPIRDDNVSHAEHQFIMWFDDRPNRWLKRVERVDLTVEGREVCDDCERELKYLRSRYPAIVFTWPQSKRSETPDKKRVQ